MDRHKIVFKCKETPGIEEGIKGFKEGEYYEGRAYNGLFEINAKWGSGSESKLVGKSLFTKYFELLNNEELIKTSA